MGWILIVRLSFPAQTDAYCGAGCQVSFGSCRGVTTTSANTATTRTASASTSSSVTINPPALKISTNAKCGNGLTCQGSSFGSCCSRNSWCGSVSRCTSHGEQPSTHRLTCVPRPDRSLLRRWLPVRLWQLQRRHQSLRHHDVRHGNPHRRGHPAHAQGQQRRQVRQRVYLPGVAVG